MLIFPFVWIFGTKTFIAFEPPGLAFTLMAKFSIRHRYDYFEQGYMLFINLNLNIGSLKLTTLGILMNGC